MLSPALASHLLRWRSPARGWLAAVMLFLLALAAEMELAALVAPRPFLLFLPAALLATALGGWAQGAAVTIVAAATGWLLFPGPEPGSGAVAAAGPTLAFLLLSGSGVALLEGLLRLAAGLARERARAARLVEAQRMLLQELQHRVANHMQFVAGVLALQARRIDTVEGARAALSDAMQRLDMLARVHRRLCQPATAEGGFATLIQEISQDLLTAAGAENLVCVVDLVPMRLEPDRMTSLALVVTELLTNALKHAFVDGRRGTISITLRQPDPGRYALEVRDDGVGIAAGVLAAPDRDADRDAAHDPGGMGGLGARILRALADRLEGRLSFQQEGGTVARLEFPASA